MAVDYRIPPWIGGAGSALGAVQAGASLGARIAEANQRAALSYAELQAQQQRFAAQMQMDQLKLEADQRLQETSMQVAQEQKMYNRMRDDQKMEMERAKNAAEFGLKKQAQDLAAQTAAQSFAEQQGYLKDQNALVKAITAKNPDLPQEEAWRQASRIAAFRHPGMGKIAPGFEGMLGKQPTANRPFHVGNQLVSPDGRVLYTGAPAKQSMPVDQQVEIASVKKELQEAGEAFDKENKANPNPSTAKDVAKQRDLLQGVVNARQKLQSIATPSVPGVNAPAAKPTALKPKPAAGMNLIGTWDPETKKIIPPSQSDQTDDNEE